MIQLFIEPDGWPCTLEECPAGFFTFGDTLCLKTSYSRETLDGFDIEVFCDGGSVFWGSTDKRIDRLKLIVQPVRAQWYTVEVDFYRVPIKNED